MLNRLNNRHRNSNVEFADTADPDYDEGLFQKELTITQQLGSLAIPSNTLLAVFPARGSRSAVLKYKSFTLSCSYPNNIAFMRNERRETIVWVTSICEVQPGDVRVCGHEFEEVYIAPTHAAIYTNLRFLTLLVANVE